MLRQCTVIFLCLALAELIVHLTGLRLPAALLGMLLLTLFLKLDWIRLAWVKDISDFLLAHLGLFFVPPGVALMLHVDALSASRFGILTVD